MPLPKRSSVTKDGLRVTIHLQRNPMRAGRQVAVVTEVRNVGNDDVTWLHDGCAISVGVSGQMPDQPWRPGIAQAGQAQEFKTLALQSDGSDRGLAPTIRFVPEDKVDRGSFGCGDVGIAEVIPPGQTVRQRLVWSGFADLRLGPPPSGPITLTGRFTGYWRARAEPEGAGNAIAVALDSWVVGGADETWLSPPEIVDAALRSQPFQEWLETQNLRTGRDVILWYRPALGLWEVGVVSWYDAPEPRMHVALVNPSSGAVADIIDRPWSKESDGIP